MSLRTAILGLALASVGGCTPRERCEDERARLERVLDALLAANQPPRLPEGHEGIDRLPVSSVGESLGSCLPFVFSGQPWDRERLAEVERRAASREDDGRTRARICVLLDRQAPLGSVWAELREVAARHELGIVVEQPWAPPRPPPMPSWVRVWLEEDPWRLSGGTPQERMEDLMPLAERADDCEEPVISPPRFDRDNVVARVRSVRERADACGCAAIDEFAIAAILWLAYAPRVPPQRWIRLGLGPASGALELAPQATVQTLVDALSRRPGAGVALRLDRR